jgi:hypothetical protein
LATDSNPALTSNGGEPLSKMKSITPIDQQSISLPYRPSPFTVWLRRKTSGAKLEGKKVKKAKVSRMGANNEQDSALNLLLRCAAECF